MTVRLEELLAAADVDALEATAAEAATTLLHVGAGHRVWSPGEQARRGKAGQEAVGALAALARANTDAVRLLIDMGAELTAITQRKPVEQMWSKQKDVDRVRALLARLDMLGNTT